MEAKSFFSNGYVQVLLTVILLGVILSLVAYAQLTFKQAEGTYTGATTISVNGEGEVLAKPDIGEFSFSVRAEATDAAKAQELSADSINTILGYLTEAGVEDKDIKTQYYNLNPKYRYEERVCAYNSYCPPGNPIIDGYEVNQTVSVKVRNLDSAGDLISGVGERGATDISSLQFTIDDETVLKAEARKKAIAIAQAKADILAKDLGVTITRMVGYYENEDGNYPMYKMGYGGDMAMNEFEAMQSAPMMPTGENTITSNVTMTYEVR